MPPAQTETAEPDVGYGTAQLVAATPGATVDASRGEAGRTSEEKVDALNKATEKTADVEGFKTIHELAAGSKEEMSLAIQQLVYVLERHFNIDFVREAPLTEVTAGIAHQRAAMSPFGESPELVDDVVVPPGVNNAGDEVLPPNLLAGSDDAAELGFGDGTGASADQLAEDNTVADLDAQYGNIEGYPSSGTKQEKVDFVAAHSAGGTT